MLSSGLRIAWAAEREMWTAAILPIVSSPTPRLIHISLNTTTINRARPAHYANRFNKNFVEANKNPAISLSCSSTGQGPSSASEGEDLPRDYQGSENQQQKKGFWNKWRDNSAETSSRLLAKLGLSAVLAYGLFDAVTYTSFFVLAFLGYEKNTGKNPAANLQALVGIVILMWTGNNVTRPFRVAGAAALAPVVDKGLRRMQKHFNFPSLVYAFALVVVLVAALCLTVVGLLILSRWGK